MKYKYIVIIVLIASVVFFFVGRSTIEYGEAKHIKGETVYGKINPDFLTVKKEFKGEIKFLPYVFWKGDTVKINEIEYISTIPDTAKIIEDFLIRREYEFDVFDNENGKLIVSPVVQYNRLQAFDYSFTPIQKEITRYREPALTPFAIIAYNTFKQASIQGGVFYKNSAISYRYIYDTRTTNTAHEIGVGVKF